MSSGSSFTCCASCFRWRHTAKTPPPSTVTSLSLTSGDSSKTSNSGDTPGESSMARHKGKRRRKSRPGAMDRHHLTSKDHFRKRGEPIDNSSQNVCYLRVGRHRAYHSIFLVLSLEEAIEALHQRGQELQDKYPGQWATLFRDRTPLEAAALFHRFHRIKGRCLRSLTGACLLEVRYGHSRQRSDVPTAVLPKPRNRMPRLHRGRSTQFWG